MNFLNRSIMLGGLLAIVTALIGLPDGLAASSISYCELKVKILEKVPQTKEKSDSKSGDKTPAYPRFRLKVLKVLKHGGHSMPNFCKTWAGNTYTVPLRGDKAKSLTAGDLAIIEYRNVINIHRSQKRFVRYVSWNVK